MKKSIIQTYFKEDKDKEIQIFCKNRLAGFHHKLRRMGNWIEMGFNQ